MRQTEGRHRVRPELYRESLKSDLSDEWINTHLLRPVAGRIVHIIYLTRITPNQVTIAGIVAGLLAAFLYMHDSPLQIALAGCCITLKDLLDSADGQLARAKQMFSRKGRFLDSIGDFFVNLFSFGAFGAMLSQRSGSISYLFMAAAAFLGISLRVSYHVFYQTAFLHLQNAYSTNRLTEEIREEDLRQDRTTRILQRIFLVLYGWQDRLIAVIDAWSRARLPESASAQRQWYSDPVALTLSGMMGLGTELFLLMLCSVGNILEVYLALNIVGMNLVWGIAVWYRRKILARRIGGGL